MIYFLLILLVISVVDCGTPSGLYQDDGTGHTILAQRFTKRDVRDMSFDLLNIMGFQSKPHPHLLHTRSPASEFLLEVYESLAIGEDVGLSLSGIQNNINLNYSKFNIHSHEYNAIQNSDAIVSFVNRGHRYSSLFPNIEENKVFWFDVSEISNDEKVLGGELRIWKNTLKEDENGDAFRISISEILSHDNGKTFELNEVDERILSSWESGWIPLNITQSFTKWIKNPSLNYGLILSTKRGDNGIEINMKSSGLTTTEDSEELQPFLVSFLQGGESRKRGSNKQNPKKRRRVARTPESTGGGRRNGRKTKKGRGVDFEELLDRPRSCQMGMLYVNFEDLGWKDWVIAPDGFIAYYCTGECSFPLTAAMNATNHAIVSTLVHTYYPQEFPKPSCAPLKLGSISMLYYDDNSNVTVKKYKDMVIKSCGCK